MTSLLVPPRKDVQPLIVPDDAKFSVSLPRYPGISHPASLDWYHKAANVVLAQDGALVAAMSVTDNHCPLASYIVTARSTDGGRSWGGHQAIAGANVWEDRAVYVVAQMSVLRDGRIVIISDIGNRHPSQDNPMLSTWQKPQRGMANHLFWSHDHGRTWSGPEVVDQVGGEPSYILEMSDGVLAFTRTQSAKAPWLKEPPQPWGDIYYRSEIVFSDDRGRTWDRTAWLADDPFHGDCEVGLVEWKPGSLLAATRIGFGGGAFGQPSRLVRSHDGGRTWGKPELAPFYGHRVHLGKLRSGRLLATFRQAWGSPGTHALLFDADEKFAFEPSSWILDESRCRIEDEVMVLRTEEGMRKAVSFSLYPAQDDLSRVEIRAVLRVREADAEGCQIGAGCWVQFQPGRVCLADRPEEGFAIDADEWHEYRIAREDGRIRIWADGRLGLEASLDSIWRREVHFGNRKHGHGHYSRNRAHSEWRSFSASVRNADAHSVDWSWNAADGYPDQFRRDRLLLLDRAPFADGGYSSWTQLPDGTIVILDYTTGGLAGPRSQPLVRAYRITEEDFGR